jgi:hypothetical protein
VNRARANKLEPEIIRASLLSCLAGDFGTANEAISNSSKERRISWKGYETLKFHRYGSYSGGLIFCFSSDNGCE